MTLATGAQFTHFAYNPNIAANALYISILACCFIGQLVQGVRYKTWDFMGPMLAGIFLEIMGYTSRIFMHKDPSNRNAFLMDNITLILGPAFLAASIYVCMGHLVRIYGQHLSALRPRTYLALFVVCDLFNLVLQGLGGGISSTQQHPTAIQAGINIVIAGLASQVVSLSIFIICCAHFASRIRQSTEKPLQRFSHIRDTNIFQSFLVAIGLATVCIFTRSVFRIVELSQGFSGPLANSELHFMILEGGMILIATISLTLIHPGPCFSGAWQTYAALSETGQEIEDRRDNEREKSKLPNVTVHELSPMN